MAGAAPATSGVTAVPIAEGGHPGVTAGMASVGGDAPASQAGAIIPYAQSGTRIHALGLEADGAVLFWKLQDTKLDSDCTMEQNEQGELHCAPVDKAAVMYTDASCTDAVVRFTGKGAGYLSAIKRTTFIWKEQAPGEPPIHGPIYRTSDYISYARTPFPQLYEWDDAQASCVEMAIPYPHGTTEDLYRVQAIPDAELASAEISSVRLTGGLVLDRITSSDGAQISGALERDERRCLLQLDGKCVPVPVGSASLWLDAGCRERAFTFAAPPTPGQVLYGVEVGTDYQSRIYRVALLGSADELMLYNSTTEGCSSVNSALWRDAMYGAEQEVTGEISELERVSLGQGRFRPAWLAGTEAGTQASVLVQVAPPPQFANLSTVLVATDTDDLCWIGFPDGRSPECTYNSSSSSFPLSIVEM